MTYDVVYDLDYDGESSRLSTWKCALNVWISQYHARAICSVISSTENVHLALHLLPTIFHVLWTLPFFSLQFNSTEHFTYGVGVKVATVEFIYSVIREYYQGSRRLGSLGKREARLMLFNFKKSMSTRSRPMPPPPWGGHPMRNPSI